MVFYEDFIKKVNPNTKGEGKEKFGLDAKKAMIWLGTGIPFLIAGLLELYICFNNGFSKKDLIIGLVFIFLSSRHIRMYATYKVTLDFDVKKLISKDITFSFDEVKSCVLKEQQLGRRKKLDTVIDVVLDDGREVIIPLMMNKKLRFVNLIYNQLGRRFTIQK